MPRWSHVWKEVPELAGRGLTRCAQGKAQGMPTPSAKAAGQTNQLAKANSVVPLWTRQATLIATFLGMTLMSMTFAHGEISKVSELEGISEYKLANGLRVLLFPDASRPTVTVNVTVLVGSRHEGYGETGMAHLLEHMLFKGTPTREEIPKLLQGRGAVFNGTTWLDRTNYYETLPAKDDNLEFALALEADRMVNSTIAREKLATEMSVVRSEFERGENDPFSILRQRIHASAFEWHNYGKSTIGNRSDIERVPVENLREFYRKYYQPDNMVLVVAGKLEPQPTLALIDKYFGPIPAPTRTLPNTYTEEPPQDGERQVTLQRVGDVAFCGAVYHIPAGSHPDFAALQVLDEILTAQPAGVLYKALVETQQASSIMGACMAFHDPGLYEVYAEVRDPKTVQAVLETQCKLVEGISQTEITDGDVARAKQRILSARENQATDSTQLAIQLSEWAALGDWRLYLLHRDRVESVTLADVKRVAAAYFTKINRTSGIFIPTEKTEKVTVPATPDLAAVFETYKGRAALAEGETFDATPANIEQRTKRLKLSAGPQVALLEKKTRGEAVQFLVRLRYGNMQLLPGKEAAGDVLPQLMMRGTKSLSYQQIRDRLDELGATMSPLADLGVLGFSVKTKRDKLAGVLDLLKQILREPTFPAAEFKVLQEETLAALEQQLTDPQAIAGTALSQHLSPYPASHPRYVPGLQEELDRYRKVTVEEVVGLYQKALSSTNVEVVAVGDCDSAALLGQLEQLFANWQAAEPYQYVPKQVFPVSAKSQEFDTPGKPNAVYLGGQVFSLSDAHPDYPALVIGNYVLGAGALSSRLGDRIRQKEGLSYGVGSQFSADALDERGALSIYAICNPANVPKVTSLIKEEVSKLLKDGITQAELEHAKAAFLDQRKVRMASDGQLAGVLADTLHHKRTMQYHVELEQKVAALNVDDVNATLRKYLKPEQLSVAVALDVKQAAEEAARGVGAAPASGAPGAAGK